MRQLQIDSVSFLYPHFPRFEPRRSSCSQAINNTPTAQFCAIGVLTVRLEHEKKSIQPSKRRQLSRTADILFPTIRLGHFDIQQHASQFFPPGSPKKVESLTSVSAHVIGLLLISPRALLDHSGECATNRIPCHMPTQLAVTTSTLYGEGLLP